MTAKAEPQGGAKLLIDLGPLLVFFLANFFAPVPPLLKIFVATGAFMIAMVAAMLFSAIRYHRISPLLWFSGASTPRRRKMCCSCLTPRLVKTRLPRSKCSARAPA